MVSRVELKIVDVFEKGRSSPQTLFNEIICKSLAHKFPNDLILKIDNAIIDKAIFSLSIKDILTINQKEIIGSKVQEIFVTTIVSKIFEPALKENKKLIIGIPEKEKAYDTVIEIIDKDGIRFLGERKISIVGKSHGIFLQIKSYFDRSEFINKNKLIPLKGLSKKIFSVEKLKYYSDEFIVIYLRNTVKIDSEEIKKFFEEVKDKKIILISQLNVEYPGRSPKGYHTFKPKKGCLNYILSDVFLGIHRHITFTSPPCLTPAL